MNKPIGINEFNMINKTNSQVPTSKRKYVGKKAMLEAIKRFSGIELPQTLTTPEVKNYIAENIFNTSKWKAYHEIFHAVCSEKVNNSQTNQEERNNIMASLGERIFLLATKKSSKYEGTTYCIGVFRLGTPNMEFILGETDNERVYKAGDEVSYIYNADYTGIMQNALDWLNRAK